MRNFGVRKPPHDLRYRWVPREAVVAVILIGLTVLALTAIIRHAHGQPWQPPLLLAQPPGDLGRFQLTPPALPPRRDWPTNALDNAGNPERGITRAEVEAALVDWCQSKPAAPLCRKLRP